MSRDIAALAALQNSVMGANHTAQKVSHFLDTGFAPLNKILSGSYEGGFPVGRMTEIYGPSSCGKTALVTKAMVMAQQMGGIAIFNDMEKSFDVDMAMANGLDDTAGLWTYRRPSTWEIAHDEVFAYISKIRSSKMLDPNAPIVLVHDSIAASIPNSSFDKKSGELNMNDTTALARVTSTTLKHVAHFAAEFNVAVLYLNQIRIDPTVLFGNKEKTPGGKAMEFFATCRLALGRKVEGKKEGQELIQHISMQAVKSKLTRPFQTTELDLRFDELGCAHFDTVGSTLEHMKKVGLVKQSGAWIEWVDGKKYQTGPLLDAIRQAGGEPVLRKMLIDAEQAQLAAYNAQQGAVQPAPAPAS